MSIEEFRTPRNDTLGVIIQRAFPENYVFAVWMNIACDKSGYQNLKIFHCSRTATLNTSSINHYKSELTNQHHAVINHNTHDSICRKGGGVVARLCIHGGHYPSEDFLGFGQR